MRAMLFAAGLGTRLRPITDSLPKALVPVGGRPLLDITIDRLKRAGVTEIVINVHHFAQQVVDHLSSLSQDLRIVVSDESQELLDTGGGLRKALTLFSHDKNNSPILIHNVDILSNADLTTFHHTHQEAEATLMVSSRPSSRYLLFDDDMRLVGWTNRATGEVHTPHRKLHIESCRQLAFAGIHCVSPSIGRFMTDYPEKFPITPFYVDNCHRLDIRGYFVPDLQLLDVGKPDSLLAAEEFLKTIDLESRS